MSGSDQDEHNLFSYGTLQDESVQLATFGRVLCGKRDALTGYALSLVAIDDPQVVAVSGAAHHPIVTPTGSPSDAVEGTVFAITAQELRNADRYEVADYKRVAVVLRSGVQAWVYVQNPGTHLPDATAES